MHENMSLISYAGCLGPSPVISAKVHSLNVCCSLKLQKVRTTKNKSYS